MNDQVKFNLEAFNIDYDEHIQINEDAFKVDYSLLTCEVSPLDEEDGDENYTYVINDCYGC